MARSHSIHILIHPHTKEIIAAFTVKHEMLTWAKNYKATMGSPHYLEVLTVRDGKGRNET